ncbi:hypothetical protein TMU01_18310 [Tenuibacillus multivorans]|uniref:Uncharacterized protein n=1 Tax=Tenuibacillus multivorans TaxID=237069 RepID=A0A1H0B017_9BACI|nr:hypothetical protein TMU01_18310 [Tenuibacillus multivorans]SDN38866.1 hypothetical protein SAMN05216498_2152 [Tenuibacillus multivorans]
MEYSQHCQGVNLLLLPQSHEKVPVAYYPHIFGLPKIGPRPPYYGYPRCEPYYPII